MEGDGRWGKEKDRWQNDAKADFSRIHFHVSPSLRAERSNPADGDVVDRQETDTRRDDEMGPLTKTITVKDTIVDFERFKFPDDVTFDGAMFSDTAWFDSATFSGPASFDKAMFLGHVRFESATFSGRTWFGNTAFIGQVDFGATTFSGDASFASATFAAGSSFNSARFFGHTSFGNTTFTDYASFDSTIFTERSWFGDATFSGDTSFDGAIFSGDAVFENASFTGEAEFYSATFSGYADFDRATFTGDVWFGSAAFTERVSFSRGTFTSHASFDSVIFSSSASFALAKFEGFASFVGAKFLAHADFNAVRGDRAFTLEDAHFEHVPDFIQAHFEEAPRLDNVRVVARMIPPYPAMEKKKDEDGNDIEPTLWGKARHWAAQKTSFPRRFAIGSWDRVRRGWAQGDDLRDMPAKWRALKRLAIQALDQDREQRFFAREIRSARFLYHWPLPIRPFGPRGLMSMARFWAGCAYGIFSNYGRSILLPAFWWGLALALAAMFYFAQHRDALQRQTNTRPQAGPERQLPETDFLSSWWNDKRSPCYTTTAQIAEERFSGNNAAPQTQVIGLSEKLRAQTDGVNEALQLALRDGFLILYGDADTAHRTYGCLYGVELYGGGTPVAIVPPQVAFWSAMHKLWSAVMIFLFRLALRNMLKMK